ncbi:hypothetical protein HYPDE_30823 [Hyphomicrobium denitrificans 1NES1]|uniref:Uncharacterized protein n=1 Tax=Hyphomicrobium denitrificans 1NES1 TaxID=670307 RepID=N0B2T5_9HYPH|nr:hypothetical protein HYPDE_30823 [Hyphomicrobium denitrificans 1NES1]
MRRRRRSGNKKIGAVTSCVAPMVIWLAPVFLENPRLVGSLERLPRVCVSGVPPGGRSHIIPSTTAITKPNDRKVARALNLTCRVIPSPLEKRVLDFVSLPLSEAQLKLRSSKRD